MKHRSGLEPTSDRAGSNKEPSKDFSKPTRAISPAFRPGPRLKPRDQNADEIIRFVREFQQRQDASHRGLAVIKKRSVLPAIGLPGNVEVAIRAAVRPAEDTFGNSVDDSGYADRSSDDVEKYVNTAVVRPAFDDFKNTGVADAGNRSCDSQVCPALDLSLLQDNPALPMKRSTIIFNAANVTHKSLDVGAVITTTTNNNTTSTSSSNTNHIVLTRIVNGSSRTSQLLRPRALPQLPPITRDDLPDRPSAPSPTATPTSPVSSSGESELDRTIEED